jgi:protein SPT2
MSSDLDDDDLFDHRPSKKSKHSRGGGGGGGGGGVGGSGFDIWSIMNPGRERSNYLARDVVSDDEDMEADLNVLEREEALSRKIAKKEEEEAEEEERRHAEEKKRKKKEREMREKGRA